MNVTLDVVKKLAFLVLRNSVFLNVTFFTFLWRSECVRPRALKIFQVESITKPKKPVRTGVCGNTQLPHGIKSRIVLFREHWKCMTVRLPMLGETHLL